MPHFQSQASTSHADVSGQLDDMAKSPLQESPQAREARLKVKDRRRRYLETHPEYYKQPSLELAGRFHCR